MKFEVDCSIYAQRNALCSLSTRPGRVLGSFATLIAGAESYLNFGIDRRILSIDYRDEFLIKLYVSILKNIEGENTGLGPNENIAGVQTCFPLKFIQALKSPRLEEGPRDLLQGYPQMSSQ